MSNVENEFVFNILVPDFLLFVVGMSAMFALLLAMF